MVEYLKKNKLNLISLLIIIGASFFLSYFLLDLSRMDISVPLFYDGGDNFSGLSNNKLLLDGNSIIKSNKLGAPFGTNRSDYMSFFMDNFDNLISKLFLIITRNIAISFNLQYLLLFPLISIISFFVLRNLKIRHSISILGSLTFAYLPYIFLRNQSHLILSEYQFVPLAILLCIWIFNDDNVFNFNKNFFKYKKNLLVIFFIILIANNGIAYYPFFTCYLLLITGISKSIKQGKLSALKQSISIIGSIFLCFLINLLPYIYFIFKNGSNPLVANRSRIEAEIYGLKITQLLIPNKSLHIPLLNKLITYYTANAPVPNEGTEHLGLVGCLGLVILLFVLFIRKSKDDNYTKNITLLSELNIFAILLGTIGGFGSIFSLIISSSIRGYNRISVFIAFICITTLCLVINEFSKVNFKPYIFYPIITAIFLFSIYEQYPNVKPNYKYVKETFCSDENFINKIEKSVSKGSMIYQLPYHQYPESGSVNAMNDYHLFTGYIHSKNLKWSYGGMKGRRSDLWNQKVSSLNTEDMIKTISIAGFNGIFIDKRAYIEADYIDLEKKIISILNTNPIYSDNKQLAFFNMSEFNKRYKSSYTEDEFNKLKDRILNSNIIQLETGFLGVEGTAPDQWIWLSNNAEIVVNNYTDNQKDCKINFKIYTGYEQKSNIDIYVNDKLTQYTSNSDGITVHLKTDLKKGINKIKFVTDAQRVYAPGDPRMLYLKITDFDFFKNNIDLK